MQEKPNLVSVIVPAYNAALFIEETIHSIYRQTYGQWEIIIVNDGSTDNTPEVINNLKNSRVMIINQANAGVAAARNKGLTYASGEFVVFFDADDLMSPDFLATRLDVLKEDDSIGYVGGLVHTFPLKCEDRKAVAMDPENEILFFNPSFVTVPSNYVFRKKILINNQMTFNNELSSSADRFFILELSKYTIGKNVQGDKGELLYRFSAESMSNNVTPKLILDNERFYYELRRKDLLPEKRTQKFKSFYFFSLAIGFGMVKYWKRFIKYMLMSFINHPVFFLESFGKRIFSIPYSRA